MVYVHSMTKLQKRFPTCFYPAHIAKKYVSGAQTYSLSLTRAYLRTAACGLVGWLVQEDPQVPA
jgi:hypothetical protein